MQVPPAPRARLELQVISSSNPAAISWRPPDILLHHTCAQYRVHQHACECSHRRLVHWLHAAEEGDLHACRRDGRDGSDGNDGRFGCVMSPAVTKPHCMHANTCMLESHMGHRIQLCRSADQAPCLVLCHAILR